MKIRPVRYGLRFKLCLLFLAVTVISFLLSRTAVSKILETQAQSIITKDMMELSESSKAVIQSTMISRGDLTEDNLKKLANTICSDLSNLLGNGVELYNSEGSLLASTIYEAEISELRASDDISLALDGNMAYTVFPHKGIVSFSYPLIFYGERVGVVRQVCDYTTLYYNSGYVLSINIVSTMITVIVAIIMFVFITRLVINPVRKLSRTMIDMSRSPEAPHTMPVQSRDEIGLLTSEYNNMAQTISHQLEIIHEEKEALSKTLSYKKDFYDRVTHDLKTPLTTIIGYSDIIKEQGASDPEFLERGITQINQEARRLLNMINELLTVSRTDSLPENMMSKVNMTALVRALEENMTLRSKRFNLTVELNAQDGVYIRGDFELLRRLVMNLADNALKYGKPGTPINITLSDSPKGVFFSMSNYTDSPLDPNSIDDIFIPFYQTQGKKKSGSVGLGLSICKEIANLHGGDVECCVSGDVVTFALWIPHEKGAIHQ